MEAPLPAREARTPPSAARLPRSLPRSGSDRCMKVPVTSEPTVVSRCRIRLRVILSLPSKTISRSRALIGLPRGGAHAPPGERSSRKGTASVRRRSRADATLIPPRSRIERKRGGDELESPRGGSRSRAIPHDRSQEQSKRSTAQSWTRDPSPRKGHTGTNSRRSIAFGRRIGAQRTCEVCCHAEPLASTPSSAPSRTRAPQGAQERDAPDTAPTLGPGARRSLARRTRAGQGSGLPSREGRDRPARPHRRAKGPGKPGVAGVLGRARLAAREGPVGAVAGPCCASHAGDFF